MRRTPPRLAVGLIVLTFAAAGCGGNTVTVQEVPGEPAQLTVPGNAAALAPASTASPTPTPTPTETADQSAATATPAPGATTQTAPEGTDGGGTAAPDDQAGATTDQPPPAGSDAEQFEDFCAQNPGAC